MELFGERGYEQTTVAEIAERAGLTERTFFRHFSDKREVLFAGGESLQEFILSKLAEVAETLEPMAAVIESLRQAGDVFFAERHAHARRRQVIIQANAELQERELIKLAGISAAMMELLREQGVDAPAASLAAEVGMAIFKVAFARWVAASEDQPLSELILDSAGELAVVAAGTAQN